jgi:hypothetical protein
MLTKFNWQTEFREAFQVYALTHGKAGKIIIEMKDIEMRVPERFMPKQKDDGSGQMVIEDPNVPEFADDSRGDRLFDVYQKQYDQLVEGKMKLISKLLSVMDKDVKTSVTASRDYQSMLQKFDLLGIWKLTEQVAIGRGAVSVYAQLVKLIQMRQAGSFDQYAKEFVELTIDLNALGTGDEFRKFLYNTLFILGLNQEQFKDKLTTIYGSRKWPDYRKLATELHEYAEATERIKDLRKDNSNGAISANAVNVTKNSSSGESYGVCWNCGSSYHRRKDCPRQPHRCTTMGCSGGHLEKFCPIKMKNNKGELEANNSHNNNFKKNEGRPSTREIDHDNNRSKTNFSKPKTNKARATNRQFKKKL